MPNGEVSAQLNAGSELFTVPFWADLPDTEAYDTSDVLIALSTPQKIGAAATVGRKSLLHDGWSELLLASELTGSSAFEHLESRVLAY